LDGSVFKNRIRTEFRFSAHPYHLPEEDVHSVNSSPDNSLLDSQKSVMIVCSLSYNTGTGWKDRLTDRQTETEMIKQYHIQQARQSHFNNLL